MGILKPITVIVADDHDMVRQALAGLLAKQPGLTVIGEACDGLEAADRALELDPDVVLMDLAMPRLDGIAATRVIRERSPRTKVVVLTASSADADLLDAVGAGASGWVAKKAGIDELVRTIELVAGGDAVVLPNAAVNILWRGAQRVSVASKPLAGPGGVLTDREREVVALLATGRSNREIAATLVISESTVRGHIHRIVGKLHLENRFQVVACAVREGLV